MVLKWFKRHANWKFNKTKLWALIKSFANANPSRPLTIKAVDVHKSAGREEVFGVDENMQSISHMALFRVHSIITDGNCGDDIRCYLEELLHIIRPVQTAGKMRYLMASIYSRS